MEQKAVLVTLEQFQAIERAGEGSFDLGLNLVLASFENKAVVITFKDKKNKKQEVKSTALRDEYKKQYKLKYKSDPVWGLKENVMAKKLLTSLGEEKSIEIINFYFKNNDEWVNKQCHPFHILTNQINKFLVLNERHKIQSAGTMFSTFEDCKECDNKGVLIINNSAYKCSCVYGEKNYPTLPLRS